MNTYERIFGAGPRGLLLSVVLLWVSWRLSPVINLPEILASDLLRRAIFWFSAFLTIIILVWSVKSLPPDTRGKRLVTRGAFRYLRHPLYAAFLSCFNFGLAIWLNNWVYLLWALVVHILWHWNIRSEEYMMRQEFPGEYESYCKVTGRFIPRIWKLKR